MHVPIFDTSFFHARRYVPYLYLAFHHQNHFFQYPINPLNLTTLPFVSTSQSIIFTASFTRISSRSFSCNAQPAHAHSLPRCLPYSVASACHGKNRRYNPHTFFQSAIPSRSCTHIGLATMATKRLKELLETCKLLVRENSSITNGNGTNGQSNEKSL